MDYHQHIDAVFNDYKGRRKGMIKALTTDVRMFFKLCDPARENLCLYGYPDGSWEVTSPAEKVPSNTPEPTLGINFSRDGMPKKEWISLIAIHSDSWLMAIAFYYGTSKGFGEKEREILFDMINGLPSVFDAVSEMKEGSAPAEEGEEITNCGSCGRDSEGDEFWIGCDVCDRWFHGDCVRVTPEEAANINQFKCPTCTRKKTRVSV